MPNGASFPIHRVTAINITSMQTQITVNSFPDPDTNTIGWQGLYALPEGVVSSNPMQSVHEWLVGPEGHFSGGTIVTVETSVLDQLRASVRARLDNLAQQHEYGGLTTSDGVVKTDLANQLKLTGAIQMGSISEQQNGEGTFSQDLVMQDGKVVTLTLAELVELGLKVSQFVNQTHARQSELLSQVMSPGATTETLNSLDLNSGWPS